MKEILDFGLNELFLTVGQYPWRDHFRPKYNVFKNWFETKRNEGLGTDHFQELHKSHFQEIGRNFAFLKA